MSVIGSVAEPEPELEPAQKKPGAGQKWTGSATLVIRSWIRPDHFFLPDPNIRNTVKIWA